MYFIRKILRINKRMFIFFYVASPPPTEVENSVEFIERGERGIQRPSTEAFTESCSLATPQRIRCETRNLLTCFLTIFISCIFLRIHVVTRISQREPEKSSIKTLHSH